MNNKIKNCGWGVVVFIGLVLASLIGDTKLQNNANAQVIVQASVGITSPVDGAIVNGDDGVRVVVDGIGNLGATTVVLFVDGNAYKTNSFTDTGFRFETKFRWNGHQGNHTLQVTLHDAYGYVVDSDPIDITVVDE